jgi:hypothetical protein
MGEEGEFIRSGFSWQQFKDNRTKMKQTCPHVNFYVSSTISIQNAYHIVPFHHTLVEGGWIDSYNSFNVNIVTEPNHLDIRILPQHHKVKLEKLYQEHIDMLSDVGDWSAKQGFDSLKNHLMQDIETAGEHLEVFKYKMKQVDKIREENFSETFPEMSDLYGL